MRNTATYATRFETLGAGTRNDVSGCCSLLLVSAGGAGLVHMGNSAIWGGSCVHSFTPRPLVQQLHLFYMHTHTQNEYQSGEPVRCW